jgi:hypothetical protein
MSYPFPYGENYSTPPSTRTQYSWQVEQNQDTSGQVQNVPQPQAYSPTNSQNQESQTMIVPSQQREGLQHQQYRVQTVHGSEGRLEFDRPSTGDTKPQVHVDTTHRTSHGSSSISPVSSTTPKRSGPTRTHSASHPYRKPQSSTSKPRRDYEQHVRFAPPMSGSIASPGSISRVTSIGSTNATERCAVRFSCLRFLVLFQTSSFWSLPFAFK